jgi:dihydroorotate dehydrogenase
VSSAADARLLHQSGADLIQLYTGMIYQGPRLVRELVAAF